MKILRASDIVLIKLPNIKLTIQPLTYAKRLEMGRFITVKNGEEVNNYAQSMMFLVQNTVKSVELEGEDVPLEFKEGEMTEDSLTDLMGILEGNTEAYKNIATFSAAAGKKIPSIADPLTGEKIEGVEVEILPKK